jgi:hypothetical protein
MEILGWIFGSAGMVFGLIAMGRISALEKKLKESGLLDPEFDSDKEIDSLK